MSRISTSTLVDNGIVLQAPALVWELDKDSKEVDGALLTLFVASGTSHPKGERLASRRFSDNDNHDPITLIIS